jgi:hypothetical protein
MASDTEKWIAVLRLISERVRILSETHAPYCPCLASPYELRKIHIDLEQVINGLITSAGTSRRSDHAPPGDHTQCSTD